MNVGFPLFVAQNPPLYKRPTTRRYPTDGTAPITPLFDQIGPYARCIADLALFGAVVTREDAPITPATIAGPRIGIDRGFCFAPKWTRSPKRRWPGWRRRGT